MTMIAKERGGVVTPFGTHGKLHVEGSKLLNEKGEVCQLKGISTHNVGLYPEYLNEACITELTDRFGLTVFRLAMYSGEADDIFGYADGDDANRAKLEKIMLDAVEICAKLGIYVIVDWHVLRDGNPNTNADMAEHFFRKVCPVLKEYDNVIYEICNEPNTEGTWAEVTRYANRIIPVIRELDADKVVIVGTPVWSQRVDEAVAEPLTFPNLVYTLHFYADTHRDELRNLMVDAVEKGLPVFVSEFGICDASGNGPVNDEQTNIWIDLLNKLQISYVLWNLSNKDETSAILAPTCTVTNGFKDEDFSPCGNRVAGYMK